MPSLTIREALEQGCTVKLTNNAGTTCTYKLQNNRLMWFHDFKWVKTRLTLTIKHLEHDYIHAEVIESQ